MAKNFDEELTGGRRVRGKMTWRSVQSAIF